MLNHCFVLFYFVFITLFVKFYGFIHFLNIHWNIVFNTIGNWKRLAKLALDNNFWRSLHLVQIRNEYGLIKELWISLSGRKSMCYRYERRSEIFFVYISFSLQNKLTNLYLQSKKLLLASYYFLMHYIVFLFIYRSFSVTNFVHKNCKY